MQDIDLTQCENVDCLQCGKILWQEVFVTKEVPITINNVTTIHKTSIKIVICNNCKMPNPDFQEIIDTEIGVIP